MILLQGCLRQDLQVLEPHFRCTALVPVEWTPQLDAPLLDVAFEVSPQAVLADLHSLAFKGN